MLLLSYPQKGNKMAGFFGLFDYSKPGRGVEKDAPQKRGMFLFLDVLFRKFWRVVTLSLCYSLFSLPQMAIYYFLSIFLLSFLRVFAAPSIVPYFGLYMTLFLVVFLGTGPASAGQSYVLRNFSRETHAWVWDDCWSNFKSNFWQGLALFCLDLVVLTVLLGAAWLYLSNAIALPLPPFVTTVFGFLAIIALLIYFIMHSFLYVLMVTFEMKFSVLLRTAFQLTMAKLWQSIAVYVAAVFIFGLFMALYFVNFAFIVLFLALGFSLVPFICLYHATTVVDYYREKGIGQNDKNKLSK